MIVRRSMHSDWLSNTYLVYDAPGGVAFFIDSGGPLEALLEEVERERLAVTHLLLTHGHEDHVAGNEELERHFGIRPTTDSIVSGTLRVKTLATPGHSDDGVTFVVNDGVAFTGDTLFKDAVGGTQSDFEAVRHSVMEVLMDLSHDTVVYPGHTHETTIGREWEENPFVKTWRGIEPEGRERVRVGGREATLVVWSPDYDGKGKAWVRFDDGRDAIIGGSRVERVSSSG